MREGKVRTVKSELLQEELDVRPRQTVQSLEAEGCIFCDTRALEQLCCPAALLAGNLFCRPLDLRDWHNIGTVSQGV